MNSVVAIDGPSASGKSTVARQVALALGVKYVDSGAVYRGIAWKALQAGSHAWTPEMVLDCLRRLKIEFYEKEGAIRFRIDGTDPGAEIRTELVSERTSEVAAMPEVRETVTTWLRDTRRLGPIVMEGRDIGTVVFPDATWKFYLDANPEERARRRSREMNADSGADGVDRVLESLRRRDVKDSGRKAAPLRMADGAVVLDTTHMTIDAVVKIIVARVRGANV